MSYNIALSGLTATSQDLNTISNNIANQSTVGFRGGRSEFAAIYNGGQPGGVGVPFNLTELCFKRQPNLYRS